MGKARTITGIATQGETPDWGPLLDAVGEDVVGDFMWMFEVTLADGRKLQAYKHFHTRCYIHLDSNGEAFVYEPRDRYRSMPVADVLAAVFLPLLELPGIHGVSDEQVARSWAAVDRLEDRAQ
jgi:hypothetical protein